LETEVKEGTGSSSAQDDLTLVIKKPRREPEKDIYQEEED